MALAKGKMINSRNISFLPLKWIWEIRY